MPFYAVACGRVPGIYGTWEECCSQVHKFKSSKYKKFKTKAEAEQFISTNKCNMLSAKPQSISSSPDQNQPLLNQPLSKSIQFPSPTSIASSSRPSSSLDSVIVDKVIKKQSKDKFAKRSLFNVTKTGQIDETIVLSDDENTPKKPNSLVINEDSVILLDDEEYSRNEPAISVKNGESSNVNRTSPRFAKPRLQTEQQLPNRRDFLDSFIPIFRSPRHDENRSKNIPQQQIQPINRGHVVVYTDGACAKNGRPDARAGIGVWWGRNDPRNLSEPLDGKPTNNRAEIWAAIKAINRAADEGYDSITVCSDSDFLIKSAKFWVFKWRNNGWLLPNNKKVANKADFIKLIEGMERIKVVWEKVKSHIGIFGNEEADRLANEAIGVRKARRN